MTVVIDCGCATYGGARSIPYLIEDYRPERLIGFDPAVGVYNRYMLNGTEVIEHPMAAWMFDGEVPFVIQTLGGHVADEGEGKPTPCIDLARLIQVQEKETVIVKLDIEGGEWELVPYLVEQGADLLLREILVEWHCADCGIGGNGRHRDECPADAAAWDERRWRIEGTLRCSKGEWNR